MEKTFTVTAKMLQQVVDITQLVTKLEIEQERKLHLRKESQIKTIYSSLAIENNSLSLDEVTDLINGKKVLGRPKDIREVQNAYDIYEHVYTYNPYNVEDFLKAHGILMADLVKEAGQFRSKDVGVYDEAGTVVHVGARPQFVSQLVTDLFTWAEKTDLPVLIVACVVHFELEIIYPFSDGNGRMGRLWQSLILSKWQGIFEWIPIETLVYENQQEYYDVLAKGNKDNDSACFIEFMLDVILKTLKEYQ